MGEGAPPHLALARTANPGRSHNTEGLPVSTTYQVPGIQHNNNSSLHSSPTEGWRWLVKADQPGQKPCVQSPQEGVDGYSAPCGCLLLLGDG